MSNTIRSPPFSGMASIGSYQLVSEPLVPWSHGLRQEAPPEPPISSCWSSLQGFPEDPRHRIVEESLRSLEGTLLNLDHKFKKLDDWMEYRRKVYPSYFPAMEPPTQPPPDPYGYPQMSMSQFPMQYQYPQQPQYPTMPQPYADSSSSTWNKQPMPSPPPAPDYGNPPVMTTPIPVQYQQQCMPPSLQQYTIFPQLPQQYSSYTATTTSLCYQLSQSSPPTYVQQQSQFAPNVFDEMPVRGIMTEMEFVHQPALLQEEETYVLDVGNGPSQNNMDVERSTLHLVSVLNLDGEPSGGDSEERNSEEVSENSLEIQASPTCSEQSNLEEENGSNDLISLLLQSAQLKPEVTINFVVSDDDIDELNDGLSFPEWPREAVVPDWLEENAAKFEGASALGSPSDRESLIVVSEDFCSRLNSDTNNGVVQVNKSAILTSLWGSGLSSTKNSVIFLFSQPPSNSSSLQRLAWFNVSSSGFFSTGKTLASSSSVQSSGPLYSQISRIFYAGQTPTNASSFQSASLIGASWIQSDEPTLVLDLDDRKLQTFTTAYSELELSFYGLESLDISVVDQLKRQFELDMKSLYLIYLKLEGEKTASATASNHAMAMITRLQKKKAAMQMEALQYLVRVWDPGIMQTFRYQSVNQCIDAISRQVNKEQQTISRKVPIITVSLNRSVCISACSGLSFVNLPSNQQ